MIVFTVLSTAVAIRILRAYKVNYLFIFELDPNYKVTFMQLIKVRHKTTHFDTDSLDHDDDMAVLLFRAALHPEDGLRLR